MSWRLSICLGHIAFQCKMWYFNLKLDILTWILRKGLVSSKYMDSENKNMMIKIIEWLCPWDFLVINTGMGCHFFLQIFLTQGLNWSLQHYRQSPALQADSLQTELPGKHQKMTIGIKQQSHHHYQEHQMLVYLCKCSSVFGIYFSTQ